MMDKIRISFSLTEYVVVMPMSSDDKLALRCLNLLQFHDFISLTAQHRTASEGAKANVSVIYPHIYS